MAWVGYNRKQYEAAIQFKTVATVSFAFRHIPNYVRLESYKCALVHTNIEPYIKFRHYGRSDNVANWHEGL